MYSASNILNGIFAKGSAIALTCALGIVCSSGAAHADTTTSTTSPHAFQQALSADQHFSLYAPETHGFKLDSSYFSGSASGVTAPDNFANFDSDQRLYALLVDGRYDFDYETSSLSTPLHPYLIGSMGLATTLRGNAAINLDSQSSSSVVPLFRLGGGVAYRLGQRWDMSLDYKAGLASPSPSDYLFTGRSQQAIDLQAFNVGMHYAF